MYKLCYLFILYLMYACLGWIMEVINSYIQKKRFINRGFMIGPYCPIYGTGVLLIIFLLKNYTGNFLVLFVLAMAVCMSLEYLTSLVMEWLFNARWWDYSNRKFNINGRVCLETAIPFGLGGLLIMYVINPIFTGLLDKGSEKFIIILGIILMVIFFTDLIISFFVVLKYRKAGVENFKDDTEEMSKKVHDYLVSHSYLTKRFAESFPNAKIRAEKFKKLYEKRKKKIMKNK